MAPKKSKSKSKSKKGKEKGTEGSNIAAGIMPLTGMVAVARKTPPPGPAQSARDLNLGLSQGTGVLNASLLGRMFRTVSPGEILQDNTEDTDTSLNDYETAQGTMPPYATVGQDGFPAGRGTDSLRDRTPTGSLRGTGNQDTMTSANMEPLYAQVNKIRRTPSKRSLPDDDIGGSSAMRRFNAEDDATFRRGSRRGSRRSQRSRASIEEHIEAQMVEKTYSGLGSSSGIGTLVRPASQNSGRNSPFSHAASPRLNTLRQQNSDLLRKQRQLEQQLAEQREQQQELIDRLVNRGLLQSQDEETRSMLNDTHNELTAGEESIAQLRTELEGVTDRTIKKTDELYASQQERIRLLEQEKQELTELNEQLQHEIFALRKKTSYRDEDVDDEAGTQIGLLKKKLSDMKDENTTLKSNVHRLNVELSRYQAKFRPLKPAELRESAGLPAKGGKPQWLVDTKYLAPLFVAYDDLIEEKDEAVREYREETEMIKQDIEAIIKENKRLHLRVEQSDAIGGPVDMTEWRQLQEQCRLVLEENQLLMEQLDVQQNKARDMHRAHMHEVTRLSKRVAEVESEKSHYETQFEHIKHKLRITESHTTHVTIENLEDQVTAIADLKRTLEEEKLKHATDLENYLTKIQVLSAAKKSLSIQLEDFTRENKELQGEVKALQKAQRKSHRKVLLFQSALEEAELKAKSSEHYLKSVVRMAENTAKERDHLAQSAHDKEREKKMAINKLIEGNVIKTHMEEKLQSYKYKANDKLEKASLRMKEQDDDFNQQRQEFHREILHLRNMLKEREQLMEVIIGEKKCVEEDLETMWQLASHDNQEMKRSLRENIRKLKQHEGLRHLSDDVMPLSCSDEDEAAKRNTAT